MKKALFLSLATLTLALTSCEEVISPAKRYFDKVNSVLRKDKPDLMRKGVNEESNEEKEEVIKQVLDEFLA